MNMLTTGTLLRLAGLTTLLTAIACSAGSKGDGSSNALARHSGNANGACQNDAEEGNDKVVCKVNADCDSDETCVAGTCTGTDGEQNDNTCGDGQDDAGDDEGVNDKVVCKVDADCDPDETCVAGTCTGTDGEQNDNACADDGEQEPSDKVVCKVNADCDPDETCVAGTCTGADGEQNDNTCGDGQDDAGDDDGQDDASDPEDVNDKVDCKVNADCDPDETCVAGRCK